jgi:hypothetical protein
LVASVTATAAATSPRRTQLFGGFLLSTFMLSDEIAAPPLLVPLYQLSLGVRAPECLTRLPLGLLFGPRSLLGCTLDLCQLGIALLCPPTPRFCLLQVCGARETFLEQLAFAGSDPPTALLLRLARAPDGLRLLPGALATLRLARQRVSALLTLPPSQRTQRLQRIATAHASTLA